MVLPSLQEKIFLRMPVVIPRQSPIIARDGVGMKVLKTIWFACSLSHTFLVEAAHCVLLISFCASSSTNYTRNSLSVNRLEIVFSSA